MTKKSPEMAARIFLAGIFDDKRRLTEEIIEHFDYFSDESKLEFVGNIASLLTLFRVMIFTKYNDDEAVHDFCNLCKNFPKKILSCDCPECEEDLSDYYKKRVNDEYKIWKEKQDKSHDKEEDDA